MNEKDETESNLASRQALRIKRLVMAMTTYGLVILSTVLVVRLGLGQLSPTVWLAFIGFAILINSAFFVIFRSGLNLRFPEPSLTREQIIISALWGMIPLHYLPAARPIILMFFIPAFSFGMLRLNRRSYLFVVAWVMKFYAILLLIEYFRGRPGFRAEYEIFLFIIYGVLLIWLAFFGGFISDIRARLGSQNRDIRKAMEIISNVAEERKRGEAEKDVLIRELREAINRIETLSGLLPICASCKRIRDDQGQWKQIESYLKEHSGASFSHGICPECAQKLYPGYSVPQNPQGESD